METRDINRLAIILKHSKNILDIIDKFHLTYEDFKSDNVYYMSIMFCFIQIGEMANGLSKGFKDEYQSLPIGSMIKTRNIIAHSYDRVDMDIVWNTCNNDIPVLIEQIEDLGKKYNFNDEEIPIEIESLIKEIKNN